MLLMQGQHWTIWASDNSHDTKIYLQSLAFSMAREGLESGIAVFRRFIHCKQL